MTWKRLRNHPYNAPKWTPNRAQNAPRDRPNPIPKNVPVFIHFVWIFWYPDGPPKEPPNHRKPISGLFLNKNVLRASKNEKSFKNPRKTIKNDPRMGSQNDKKHKKTLQSSLSKTPRKKTLKKNPPTSPAARFLAPPPPDLLPFHKITSHHNVHRFKSASRHPPTLWA